MNFIIASFLLFSTILRADKHCPLSKEILIFVKNSSSPASKDIKRNSQALKALCVNQIEFDEGEYHWKMLLVTNPKQPKGPFWFLPHDNEDTAFDAAIYATQKYGGGFLAVMANDQRYFAGQDPNRNFSDDIQTAKICKQQKYPAPKYSKNIFTIIDTYRADNIPYLALHNNKDGWYGNGGQGGVSILSKSSQIVKSYPASEDITHQSKGIKDEDSLVYIAGTKKTPDQIKLKRLLELGLNVKYEIIDMQHNDCSLSNYIVLKKHTEDYYNIEVEHGDLATQKKMIDKIINTFSSEKSKGFLSPY